MGDDIDRAAVAFDAAMGLKPDRSTGGKAESGEGPTQRMFPNVGELDGQERAGGDEDPDSTLYEDTEEEDKAGPRDTRKRDDAPDGDGEGDESGDDADAEDADGDDEEEEEEDSDESAFLEQEVQVTVDGEPVKVTVKEALEGYTRTETFHRRMNQLDEAKKIVRKAAADAVHNYEYSTNLAKQMQAHMEQLIPKEPNWDEEFAKDPNNARTLQKYYEQVKNFRNQLQGNQADAMKKANEANHAQLTAFAEEESKRFDDMNHKQWSDPKKKVKDLQSMRRTALSSGFSEEELSQVYDSRMLTVLLKASKFDRMMAARPKPINRDRGKPIAPGTGSAKQRTVRKGVTSAMKRLNRSGSIEDAAVVFDELIARS